MRTCFFLNLSASLKKSEVKMKSYIISQNRTKTQSWDITQLPDPTLQHGEVLIQMKAVSVNYRDLIIARSESTKPGLIPLSDGAGEIVKIGSGVSKWKVGDRVAGNFFSSWHAGPIKAEYHQSAMGGAVPGMFTEYKNLNENSLVKIPDHMSFEEGATLPCAAVTAWNALTESSSHFPPGSTIVTLGTGGVSVFALQLAKQMGYQVISTTSSDAKADKLKSLGADYVINYKTNPDWEKEVLKITNGLGADQIIEVGGAGTLNKSLQAVRSGGIVSLIGVLTGFAKEINPVPILNKSIRVQGIYVGSVQMFESMNQAMSVAKLKPIIDEIFPFDNANAALNKMESAGHFGKIVISMR
jgi:NADPH:quinone reductase-like Zn-dependent oxidoreductase